MESAAKRERWKTLLAFAIIYFVWGSTFLAIRVGVREVPPLLLAAMRFFAAGLFLYVWVTARGERTPSPRQWAAASLLAFFIFVCDYGLLFWAEQRVPSGIAAVMLALIPAFMALSEIIFLGTQKLTWRLAFALAVGLGGVGVLMSRSLNLGGTPIDRLGAAALIAASLSWSVSSVLTRKLPLPESKMMSSGAQMLAGGILLTVVAAGFGEFSNFHPSSVSRGAWFALLYLIVAGSIIGYTAYVWLIHHESPTRVGTYAYVNPVVAVLVGYFLGGEALDLRTVLGTLLVLVGVIVITDEPEGGRDAAVGGRGRRLGEPKAMSKVTIRPATVADIPVLVRHRRMMWWDMGRRNEDALALMEAAARKYFDDAVADGSYRGFLAVNEKNEVAGGGGIVISAWPGSLGQRAPQRAMILNMYVEEKHRRRGVARFLMNEMIRWCRENGFTYVSLHASDAGRPLYEKLGFKPANEMRLEL